jgi:hypothetical protein
MSTPERITVWRCSHCGASGDNNRNWCALGCGFDYNEMQLVQVLLLPTTEAEERALVERVARVLDPNAFTGEGYGPEAAEQSRELACEVARAALLAAGVLGDDEG